MNTCNSSTSSTTDEEKSVHWTKKNTPLWDTFQDPPISRNKGSARTSGKLLMTLRVFKFFVCILTFVVVLVSAALSNLTFIAITQHLHHSTTSVRLCRTNDWKWFSMSIPFEQRYAWISSLIICFAAPELLTFLRSVRICLFKDVRSPKWGEFLMISIPELLHSLGMAALSFQVFPQLHPLSALALCNCVSLIPAIISVAVKIHFSFTFAVHHALTVLSFLSQLTPCFLLFFISDSIAVKLSGIHLLLVSFRWWENYAQLHDQGCNFSKNFVERTKYKIYLFLAPAKIIIFALCAVLMCDLPILKFIHFFPQLWQSHQLSFTEIHRNPNGNALMSQQHRELIFETKSTSVLTLVCIQILSSYLCFAFAKFACKINITKFGLVLPLCLASPVAFLLAVTVMSPPIGNLCIFENWFGNHLYLAGLENQLELSERQIALWILWWASQLWMHRHIVSSNSDRNAPTERLFVYPSYSGLVAAQCIAMNYRMPERKGSILDEGRATTTTTEASNNYEKFDPDETIRLIVCATMWHETEDEMLEFLKSIIRLDEDQCARRMAKMYINGEPDCDYFELETNIFFDDAFVVEKERLLCDSNNPPLGSYVKILINSIERAASEVYGAIIRIKAPVKIDTPYGGRLVWTLPGRSKLIAHLKNKDKVRHKKRWSQVMYMYYLLGYRIMELENISLKRKAKIAKNTFLLALDGDIDFQPQAVHLLIDRMKVIDELGAACGRIHPVGNGPMVWYQIFEYAIGHWLQKATEHIIGCVLCSPGCFSLFRGSALMENSVMKKYTQIPEKPLHYIQYDQGEDRWLCTLLLKQGLRVEYSAASDAYTHAPETFNEFYNQRRRWIPSTIANIFDLLSDAELVVKNNGYISTPYIWYEIMLMIGTVLGPGTIFLMMVGASVTVFSINIWTAFLWNFFPVLSFIISCIYFKSKFQIILAFGISTMYCLVMMAVLIGIIIQIIDDGPLAPSSVFFLIVFCQIIIAGFVHPQEVKALFSGVIYYVTIPSMYMLLLIFSVFNMNDVSWGTREVAEKKEAVRSSEVTEQKTIDEESCKNSLNLENQGWMNDPLLSESTLGEITLKEKRFWKDLIKLYLKPLYQTKQQKIEIVRGLRELRNFCAFAFFMVNTLFVLVVFLLQLHKDYLHLDWPIGAQDFITFDDINSQIYIYRKYKELDPIGLCFVLFFGFILVIQFLAMFVHRYMTISHILAATHLYWFQLFNWNVDNNAAQDVRGNAVGIAQCLQRPKKWEENWQFASNTKQSYGSDEEYYQETLKYFGTINQSPEYCDLQKNFEERFFDKNEHAVNNLLNRKSMMILNQMRLNSKLRLTKQMSAPKP